MNYIKNNIILHKSLISFTLLNYIDKFIAFSLPLLVLYISKNQLIYNNIEYIFSIAGIAISFLDFGIGTYFFYGYKQSEDRVNYIERVKQYFAINLIVYELIALLLIPSCFLFDKIGTLLPFVFIRVLYLLYVNFYSSYYRLKDAPVMIFWLSIPVNVLSFLSIYILKNFQDFTLFVFFAPQIVLLCVGTYYFVLKRQKVIFQEIKQFFVDALTYSWPILINVTMVSYINNFGKIYAYNYLSQDEMYQISYTLRISLIIQMAHASIIAFYSKAIYEDVMRKLNVDILKKYILFLLIAVLLFFVFIFSLNQLDIIKPITMNLANFLIVIYTILWCFRSYFEMYYGKYNRNKIVLLFSLISSFFFTGYIMVFGVNNFLQLSIVMVLTSLISLLLTILFLKVIIFDKFINLKI